MMGGLLCTAKLMLAKKTLVTIAIVAGISSVVAAILFLTAWMSYNSTAKTVVIEQLSSAPNPVSTYVTVTNADLEANPKLAEGLDRLNQNIKQMGLRKSTMQVTDDVVKSLDEYFLQKYSENIGELAAGKVLSFARSHDLGIGFVYEDNYYEYFAST